MGLMGWEAYRVHRISNARKTEWKEEEREESQIWEPLGLLGAMELDSSQLPEPRLLP